MNDRLAWLVPFVGFLLLALSFQSGVWDFEPDRQSVTLIDSSVTATPTVRFSAAEQDRRDGDTSMYACYSCHEPGNEPVVLRDEEGRVQYEEHTWDFELRHGQNNRNEYCYTCHNADNLEQLITPQGLVLDVFDSNPLCGGCHGTTYRDWEAGLHGRVSGFWLKTAGAQKKEDCASCHNAHNPAFPSMAPWPPPQPLRSAHPDTTSHE
jgi:formate-dependent nitrite reductase cytochrome c552 subunit